MKLPKLEKVDVCIYHHPCTDGFSAAWAVYDKFGDKVEFLPGTYSDGKYNSGYWVGKVSGKHVVCADFSFPRELMEKMHEAAASLLVIDHHASAQKALGDLAFCYFDMQQSGAMLSWKVTHPGREAPMLLKYVQDQDLWNWELPGSKEICTYINAQPRDFATWGRMVLFLNDKSTSEWVQVQGEAMLCKEARLIADITEAAEEWTIGGHLIKAVNTKVLCSDVAGGLAQGYPFGACYWIKNGLVTWALRVGDGDFDVSKLASSFPGGGGHPAAAGFSVPIERVNFVKREVK